jgi:hypothetical protein
VDADHRDAELFAVSGAIASTRTTREPIAIGRVHAFFRFSTGVTVAYILSEALGWAPTFLAPVLFAVLVTSLPSAPPFKVGLALVLVMAAAASVSFLLPSLLSGAPQILFGAIGLVVFLAFAAMAQGRAKLPATLLLLSIATVPVIAMIAPAYAGLLPTALVRSMAVAVLILWAMYALWPQVVARAAPPAVAPVASPVRAALIGTAVVMPMMLVYLLFGMADALPVLVTTVLLVANFDPRQGAMQGLGMMLGNLFGGLIGLIAFLLLGMAPSLIALALITFLIAAAFAIRIDRGGPGGAIALLTCNSALIIFSTAIANPSASSGVWLTRLLQFALACLFAIGMMSIVWGKNHNQNHEGRSNG